MENALWQGPRSTHESIDLILSYSTPNLGQPFQKQCSHICGDFCQDCQCTSRSRLLSSTPAADALLKPDFTLDKPSLVWANQQTKNLRCQDTRYALCQVIRKSNATKNEFAALVCECPPWKVSSRFSHGFDVFRIQNICVVGLGWIPIQDAAARSLRRFFPF